MLICLVSLALKISSLVAAMAESPPSAAKFAKATPIGQTITEAELKKILLRYQGLSELTVDFEQTKALKEMKQPLRSKGHLTVRPPSSIIYKITSPSKLTIIMNEKTITIENGAGVEKTTQILKTDTLKGSKEHRHMQAMMSWLQMNSHELATHYKILRGSENAFHFEPLTADDAPFKSLEMMISKNGDVQSLVMTEPSDDAITFHFGVPKMIYAKKK